MEDDLLANLKASLARLKSTFAGSKQLDAVVLLTQYASVGSRLARSIPRSPPPLDNLEAVNYLNNVAMLSSIWRESVELDRSIMRSKAIADAVAFASVIQRMPANDTFEGLAKMAARIQRPQQISAPTLPAPITPSVHRIRPMSDVEIEQVARRIEERDDERVAEKQAKVDEEARRKGRIGFRRS